MENLLENIRWPEDLRKLPADALPALAEELRAYIIQVMASHPGHLGSSLGVVELTVALHYVFNTPYDRIVWDVGHQAYPHKILTGRRDRFPSIRTLDGLSGFPTPFESEYDAFATGHSATSISAALGMAVASKLRGETKRQHIAVIGDGSMTGGLAFEGLNNAGVSNSNILVILNDNGISIDKSTGALSRYFTKISTSRRYNNMKNRVWNQLGKNATGQGARHALSRMTGAVKSLFFKQGNLFEALDFRYFGPVDGHDVPTLIRTLEALKQIQGPKLLHIVTTKGKGLKTAEAEPTLFHAPGQFDSRTGELIKPGINLSLAPRYQDVFGKTIIELARQNPRIVGITPAMPTGCSLNLMMKKMPERTFDVGIAEQHAVTFAAGLAADGMIPFCNIYSSFMQRAYDQVIHDVALQKLPVVFCLDRAGIVGEDGATHHGAFDLAYFRPIPNLTIASPLNERALRNLMFTAQSGQYGAFVIRYPRGRGVTPRWKTPLELLPPGQGQTLREGRRIAFVSLGHIGNTAIAATRGYLREIGADWDDATQGPGLFDMIYLKPLDTALLAHIFAHYDLVYTLEDGVIDGGLGSAVCEYAAAMRAPGDGSQATDDVKTSDDFHATASAQSPATPHATPAVKTTAVPEIHRLGMPSDRFVLHGPVEALQHQCGYAKEDLLDILRREM